MTTIEEYQKYVNDLKLSSAGSSVVELTQTLENNYYEGVDICRMLCGAIGQSAECGELLTEVLLPMSPKVIDELADVFFYTMVSARSLGISFTSFYYNNSFEGLTKKTVLDYTQELIIVTAEYLDIIKKVLFQGKKVDKKLHSILSDKIWYQYELIHTIAYKLEVPIDYVILVNKNKLDRRYKGTFTVAESEISRIQ